MKCITFFLIIELLSGLLFSQDIKNEMFSLSQIKQGVKSKRISSFDKTGGNDDCIRDIKDGAKVTIMDVKGAGVITHIWITMAPNGEKLSRNNIVIRMYWDGNSFASVESPLGPFFGNGWDESYKFISEPLSVSPAWGMSYVSYFAMPFSKGAKIEIENQTGTAIESFYFNIDYTELVNYRNLQDVFMHGITMRLPGHFQEEKMNGGCLEIQAKTGPVKEITCLPI